jgi:hypothetical protein
LSFPIMGISSAVYDQFTEMDGCGVEGSDLNTFLLEDLRDLTYWGHR